MRHEYIDDVFEQLWIHANEASKSNDETVANINTACDNRIKAMQSLHSDESKKRSAEIKELSMQLTDSKKASNVVSTAFICIWFQASKPIHINKIPFTSTGDNQ